MSIQVSYSRQEKKRPPYINFRMRKLIYNMIFERTQDAEISQYIADNTEQIVSENFWIKDKRGVNMQQVKKVA